jgi:hypothetical protein
VISFEEWRYGALHTCTPVKTHSNTDSTRDFLLFMPQEPSLRTIYSYYLSTVNVNSEGDVNVSDEVNLQGLGSLSFFLYQTPQGPIPEVEGTLRLDSPTITKIPLLDVPLVSWLWPGLGIWIKLWTLYCSDFILFYSHWQDHELTSCDRILLFRRYRWRSFTNGYCAFGPHQGLPHCPDSPIRCRCRR